LLCEQAIENLYLGRNNKPLNDTELKTVRELNDRTLAMITDVQGDKEFQLSPKFPFTKQDAINRLEEIQNKFDRMIPRVASPRP
jgi:hypothetical protein